MPSNLSLRWRRLIPAVPVDAHIRIVDGTSSSSIGNFELHLNQICFSLPWFVWESKGVRKTKHRIISPHTKIFGISLA